jgi:hypothetical protein
MELAGSYAWVETIDARFIAGQPPIQQCSQAFRRGADSLITSGPVLARLEARRHGKAFSPQSDPGPAQLRPAAC